MPVWKPGIYRDKDPDSVKLVQWDITAWLNGLTLTSYTVSVNNVVLDSDNLVSNVISAYVSGGVVGVDGSIQLRVVRSDTVSDDFTSFFNIIEQ